MNLTYYAEHMGQYLSFGLYSQTQNVDKAHRLSQDDCKKLEEYLEQNKQQIMDMQQTIQGKVRKSNAI